MSKIIKLTKGKEAIVDDKDFEWLSKFKWCANLKSKTHWYAQRAKHSKIGFKKYKSSTIYMHREILQTDQEIDHINGNTLDNRRQNLRSATRSEQCRNMSSRINSTSKFVGVHFHKMSGKWRSQIRVNGKVKSLGLFYTDEEARIARKIYIEENDLDRFKR